MESIKQEFIGREAEIVRSANKQLLGLKGKIVDETRQAFKMLVRKHGFNEFKMIMKQGNSFRIGTKIYDGQKLNRRPEDRIKIKDE